MHVTNTFHSVSIHLKRLSFVQYHNAFTCNSWTNQNVTFQPQTPHLYDVFYNYQALSHTGFHLLLSTALYYFFSFYNWQKWGRRCWVFLPRPHSLALSGSGLFNAGFLRLRLWHFLIAVVDCSPSGPSVCGILQARILEWAAIPLSRRSASCYLRCHLKISSVQSLSCVWLFATPWTAACQASLSLTSSQNFLKLMSIKLVMPSNHLILCRPLLLPPSICPSIRVFANESVLRIKWPKYWSFSFSISPSNEYSGLISFRMDWLDLFAVQGTLKSLLQHHSSKASILQHSAFFIVQLSHPYITIGKTIAH